MRFENIEPGNVDKRRDDIVEVRVRAAGLRPADTVVLHYSATGNPADDVALPMQTDEGRYLWKTVLPPGSEGLKQDLFYYIQAGDAASERYRIRVLSTPVINVRSVRYDYPAYTGLPPRTVEKQGDLKALEGTRVTVVAEANQPIRAAHVAFDQARNKDVELKPNGLEASGGFDLALKKDRETPVHSSYVLRFVNIDGEENPKPAEHRIDVTADQSPEVRVTEPNTPPEKELSLPMGGLDARHARGPRSGLPVGRPHGRAGTQRRPDARRAAARRAALRRILEHAGAQSRAVQPEGGRQVHFPRPARPTTSRHRRTSSRRRAIRSS